MKEKLKRRRQESIICQTVIPQREQKNKCGQGKQKIVKIESQKKISQSEKSVF